MSDLLALAERVEAASGPDRELDVAIWRGITPNHEALRKRWAGSWTHADVQARKEAACELKNAPDFTASLDAAMTLVPEGWCWAVRNGLSTAYAEMADEPFIETAHEKATGVDSCARSPALALTAAALRARAASTPSLNAEIAGMEK
jgi:hypothetical protein